MRTHWIWIALVLVFCSAHEPQAAQDCTEEALVYEGDEPQGCPEAPVWPDIFPDERVDRGLYEALAESEDGFAGFLVYLNEQPDLSEARDILDWEERGHFVLKQLQLAAVESQAEVERRLMELKESESVRSFKSFFIVNALFVEGTAEAVDSLSRLGNVRYMERIHPLIGFEEEPGESVQAPPPNEWNVEAIGASRVWNQLGATGEGVVVATIDDAVWTGHPDLSNNYRGTGGNHVLNYFDAVAYRQGLVNNFPPAGMGGLGYPFSHGTSVMGTIAGKNGIGVAPDSKWIHARWNVPGQNFADPNHIIQEWLHAGEWILAPFNPQNPLNRYPSKRPHIVNNAWGWTAGPNLFYYGMITNWRNAGILPVFSAGNEGSALGSLTSPGDYNESFTVGAVDDQDVYAMFSGRGPSTLTSATKPDVVAPGVDVRSGANGSSTYASWTGTSIASAHASGCAALIYDAINGMGHRPLRWVEAYMRSTAKRLPPWQPNVNDTYGYGRLDCFKAVERAQLELNVRGDAEADDAFGHALAAGDFDGDGHSDLAIGAPTESVDVYQKAGAVNVLYGSSSLLQKIGDQFWHQSIQGVGTISGWAETGDQFGRALAAGDFNGDGYDDLAIGAPYEAINGNLSSGAVNVLYGSANGLTGNSDQMWHQDSPGIGGIAYGNWFGYSLTAGDFDGDGYDELAIGSPRQLVNGVVGAGAVYVLAGTGGGLSTSGGGWFDQSLSWIAGAPEKDDQFGWSLAAGDFDNDGRDELAVGVPYEDIGTIVDAGAVNVLTGTINGLGGQGQMWHQDSLHIEGQPGQNDLFGWSLAAGQLGIDAGEDLAIGVPGETIATKAFSGAVNVIYGDSGVGLYYLGNQMWFQDVPSIQGVSEVGDQFGYSVAIGNFGHPRFGSDLVVGVPGEDLNGITDAGAINVIYNERTIGSSLVAAGNRMWHQEMPGVWAVSEPGDRFGASLAVADFDTGRMDLAIGVPNESIGNLQGAGAVNVLYSDSATSTVIANPYQMWFQTP